MALFKKTDSMTAYLKMGIYGEAGSGKSFTASRIAAGLAQYLEAAGYTKPPVMFLDTEAGAGWVKPIFDAANIDFLVAATRSFDDLLAAVKEAEIADAILIVDSQTHICEELREAYLSKKKIRTKNKMARIELPDWNIIKAEFSVFTTSFLNSKCHIILCGRAGNIYEFQEQEEGKRREMITVGTRMAGEKGLAYEPSLLVEMTSRQVGGNQRVKTIQRTATVLKDRSNLIDGDQFENPDFGSFLPHIKALNIGGNHAGFDASRNSEGLFAANDRSDNSLQRNIVLDEIQSLITMHFPGQSAEEKRQKCTLLREHFRAAWTEMEKVMPLHDLREGYDSLHRRLEGAASKYGLPDQCIEDLKAAASDLSAAIRQDEQAQQNTPALTGTDGGAMQAGYEAAMAGKPASVPANFARYLRTQREWLDGHARGLQTVGAVAA